MTNKKRTMVEHPLEIPFEFLAKKPKVFHRNIRIFSLWNEGYSQILIGKIVSISNRQVGTILRGESEFRLNRRKSQIWQKTHSDYLIEYGRQWRHENKKYLEEYHREYNKTKRKPYSYRDVYPERHRLYMERTREHRNAVRRKWLKTDMGKAYKKRIRKIRAKHQGVVQGYVPDDVDDILLNRQNYICGLCDNYMDESESITLDHIIPVTRKDSLECICNMRMVHLQCNSRKNNRLDTEIPENYFQDRYVYKG